MKDVFLKFKPVWHLGVCLLGSSFPLSAIWAQPSAEHYRGLARLQAIAESSLTQTRFGEGVGAPLSETDVVAISSLAKLPTDGVRGLLSAINALGNTSAEGDLNASMLRAKLRTKQAEVNQLREQRKSLTQQLEALLSNKSATATAQSNNLSTQIETVDAKIQAIRLEQAELVKKLL